MPSSGDVPRAGGSRFGAVAGAKLRGWVIMPLPAGQRPLPLSRRGLLLTVSKFVGSAGFRPFPLGKCDKCLSWWRFNCWLSKRLDRCIFSLLRHVSCLLSFFLFCLLALSSPLDLVVLFAGYLVNALASLANACLVLPVLAAMTMSMTVPAPTLRHLRECTRPSLTRPISGRQA